MNKKFYLVILGIFLIANSVAQAKEKNYYEEGIELFKKNEFKESKIFFERDIVYNPKSEISYLYLSKIFKINENDEEEEINLNNVLLLNPKNEEAIYLLALLKIKQSDYKKAN